MSNEVVRKIVIDLEGRNHSDGNLLMIVKNNEVEKVGGHRYLRMDSVFDMINVDCYTLGVIRIALEESRLYHRLLEALPEDLREKVNEISVSVWEKMIIK